MIFERYRTSQKKGDAMTKWQATFLGLKHLPRELSGFEIEAFFTLTLAERQMIEERRRPALKLGLALQIGFLRMSGRLLDSVRIVPPALWLDLTRFSGHITVTQTGGWSVADRRKTK